MGNLGRYTTPLWDTEVVHVWNDFTDDPAPQAHTYRVADLAAGADLGATVVFAPGRRVLVTSVSICPDGTAAGVDDSNTSVWTVTDGTNTVASATYNTANAHPTDSVVASLGAITNGVIEADGRLELSVTNGATADTVATEVTITYLDLTGYCGCVVVAPDDGTVSIGDTTRGVLALAASDGSAADNDEIYLASQHEVFLFALGRPLYARARLQFSEANTDDANVCFGFASAVGANLLVDDGAGPRASGSLALVEKRDGETAWRLTVRNGSTTLSELSNTTAGGSAYQVVELLITDLDATNLQAVAVVDGKILRNASSGRPISFTLPVASATEMQLVAGVKNGGANAETLNLDFWYAHQAR